MSWKLPSSHTSVKGKAHLAEPSSFLIHIYSVAELWHLSMGGVCKKRLNANHFMSVFHPNPSNNAVLKATPWLLDSEWLGIYLHFQVKAIFVNSAKQSSCHGDDAPVCCAKINPKGLRQEAQWEMIGEKPKGIWNICESASYDEIILASPALQMNEWSFSMHVLSLSFYKH